jgi:PAS domain S-box-containing protein
LDLGIHPGDAEKFNDGSRQALKSLKFDEKIRVYHHQDGQWRWIRVISTNVPAEAGRSKHVNGMLVDITETKKKERELENKTQKMEETNAAHLASLS